MVLAQRQVVLCATVVTIGLFLLFDFFAPSSGGYVSSLYEKAAASRSRRHAFCVFLSHTEVEAEDSEDHYFIGARMLAYQLLHDPETRTNTSIDFVVLVAKEVPATKRQRLRRDGAIVVEADDITVKWMKPRRARWNHVLDKLQAWRLIQYEKVLLLDSDVVVTRRLDPLFHEFEAQPLINRGKKEWIRKDEAPQPSMYLMAGSGWPTFQNHRYPARRSNKFDAGFILLKPDITMYEHYMSVIWLRNRFDSDRPEQNLLNYVHRRKNGNMPWKQISPDWTISSPNYNDYEHGIASFHEKYWGGEKDKKLQQMLLRSRWKMEGFFNSYDP